MPRFYARTNGDLKRWYVDIGAHVKRGQLLAEIETPEIDQQLQQARADLKTAQANLNLAKITADRWQSLFKTNSVSKQETDQAVSNLSAMQATVESNAANVRRLEELQSFILIGQPPATFSLPPAPLNQQPPSIPVGLPSQLLERRPDIAAAERRVAEANEQIGIARAAYFPTVALDASAGFEGTSVSNWLDWPSLLWAVGASVTQTLFDGGRRRATSEAALANYDATVATYRQTTLTAFQQVEDNLAALRVLMQEAEQQQRAVASAQESLELSSESLQGRCRHVPASHHRPDHCTANERNAVDILRRRMDASVLLIKAIGGGWHVSNLPQLSQALRTTRHD